MSGHSSDTKADVLVQWRSYSLHHELHAYSRSCRPEINERELEGKESTRMCGTRKSFYSFYFVSLYKIIYLDAVLSISYNISTYLNHDVKHSYFNIFLEGCIGIIIKLSGELSLYISF